MPNNRHRRRGRGRRGGSNSGRNQRNFEIIERKDQGGSRRNRYSDSEINNGRSGRKSRRRSGGGRKKDRIGGTFGWRKGGKGGGSVRRKRDRTTYIAPTRIKCSEDLRNVTAEQVFAKHKALLNPHTNNDERLAVSAWLEKLKTIERGFVVSIEILNHMAEGKMSGIPQSDAKQLCHFAAMTLRDQADLYLKKKFLQQNQDDVVKHLLKFLKFFMVNNERAIGNALAFALVATLHRSTISVDNQEKIMGGLLTGQDANAQRALNEAVAVCLNLIPEVSKDKSKSTTLDQNQRSSFNLQWKKKSDQVISLLANMIKQFPGLTEVALKCVASWVEWSNHTSNSEALKWIVQSSFDFFKDTSDRFNEETLYAAMEVICNFISFKAKKKDAEQLRGVAKEIVRIAENQAVLQDLDCRCQCLAQIMFDLIKETAGAKSSFPSFLENDRAFITLLFKLTNIKDPRVVHRTLEGWSLLCKQGGWLKRTAEGIQPQIVQRAIIAIVLSAAFPANWDEKDDDFQDGFYHHRECVKECITSLVKNKDVKWFTDLCRKDLEQGSNWRTIEGGLFALLAISKHFTHDAQLCLYLLNLCLKAAQRQDAHIRLKTTICMLFGAMSSWLCDNLSAEQLEKVVQFLANCLQLSQFDELWPCSDNEQHPAVNALVGMMTAGENELRGRLLEQLLNAYLVVEKNEMEGREVVSSPDRLRLFRALVRLILKHVRPQYTGCWTQLVRIVWDLFRASVTKQSKEKIAHAAQVAHYLYKDTDKTARNDTNTKQKTLLALQQLGQALLANWDFVLNLLKTVEKEDEAELNHVNTPPILQSVCEMIRYALGRVEKQNDIERLANDLVQTFTVRPESYLLRPFQGLLASHAKSASIRKICYMVIVKYLEAIQNARNDQMPNARCFEQIFTLISKFIKELPRPDRETMLGFGQNPSFPLLFAAMLARMTQIRDFTKDHSVLDPILNALSSETGILQYVYRAARDQQHMRPSTNFLAACICNFLLCLAFWGVPPNLTESVAKCLVWQQKRSKSNKSHFEGTLKAALGSELWHRIHSDVTNVLNPQGDGFRLAPKQMQELTRGIQQANSDQRVRVLLSKVRDYFPTANS